MISVIAVDTTRADMNATVGVLTCATATPCRSHLPRQFVYERRCRCLGRRCDHQDRRFVFQDFLLASGSCPQRLALDAFLVACLISSHDLPATIAELLEDAVLLSLRCIRIIIPLPERSVGWVLPKDRTTPLFFLKSGRILWLISAYLPPYLSKHFFDRQSGVECHCLPPVNLLAIA